MKKLLLLAILFPFVCFSQERVNDSRIKFDELGVKFNNVSGWEFSSGVWEEKKNKTSCMDFKFFRFRSFKYKNLKYYVFTVFSKQVFYEYPETEVGIFTQDMYNHYIFTEQQFQELKKFKKVKSKFDYLHDYFDLVDANKIIDVINGEASSHFGALDYNKTLEFRLEKTKGKDVRFVIPFPITCNFINFDKAYFEFLLEDFKDLTSLK